MMLAHLRARSRGERGFTLIELMVVVLIIGILIAIALVSYLGARTRAQDRAAHSSLRSALGDAKILFSERDTYVGVDNVNMQSVEPTLTFLAASVNSTGPLLVSVAAVDANTFVAAAQSRSGTCFALKDTITLGVTYARAVAGGCNATNANATGTFAASW